MNDCRCAETGDDVLFWMFVGDRELPSVHDVLSGLSGSSS